MKGFTYVALFNLSIGLERILKLIVILDHYCRTGKFPTVKEIKAKGHNIAELIVECQAIATRKGTVIPAGLLTDTINLEIVELLTGFAVGSRYANLDNLEEGNRINDPLTAWKHIVDAIYLEDVPERTRNKNQAWREFLTSRGENWMTVMGTDYEGKIHTLDSMMESSAIIMTSAPYACRRICQLLHPFKELLDGLAREAGDKEETLGAGNSFPETTDYLRFLGASGPDVLKMKDFGRYGS